MSDPTQPTRGSGAAAVAVLVAGVLVVLVLAGAGVYFLSEWVGERQAASASPNGPAPGGAPAAPSRKAPDERPFVTPVMSVDGFESLLDELERETGSTRIVELVVYPEYASITVPDASKKGRTRSLYYDGDFSSSALGTSDARPFDARQVEAELVADLSRRIRRTVDDADQWYVIVRAPDQEGAAVWAYASNEYGEGGYVSARLDGTVVRRTGW